MTRGKAKIVCTIGPATQSVDMLAQLMKAGMDVARLNFSHGTHDDHLAVLRNLQEASRRTRQTIAVLQDLQGPKIRIGEFKTPTVELRMGNRFTITTRPLIGDAQSVSTSYDHLPADVRRGETILLDDGKIRLNVLEGKDRDVVCEVIVGGALSAHKGINLPGTNISQPSFTAKDLLDLEFGLSQGVDYVALSFVRTAEDIRGVRNAMRERGRILPVVAKIEKPQAVANIDAIVAEADAVMVARGDLGVELPAEDVPILQKMIIRKCNQAGKPVIVATQMLESMVGAPNPTRAEASDVANAVIDGGDAVMLSEETATGGYPLEAVRMMDRIIRKVEAETVPASATGRLAAGGSRPEALGVAACVLAEQMDAAAIVIVTRSGETARVVSRYRPRPHIIAVTDGEEILKRLALHWGVRGLVIGSDDLNRDSDRAMEVIESRLVSEGQVRAGDYVVFLAGQPFFARGSTNFIKVEKVKG